MKIRDTIPETIMTADDKDHIEAIARRNGIGFMDHTAAMLVGAKDHLGILGSAVSFSAANGAGNSILYLDMDEPESEDQAYFIALHEMAHSVLKHHHNGKDHVDNEIEAWEWALAHAQRFPEDYTLMLIQNSLGTYTDSAEAEQRPDSLLARANGPALWEEHGWDYKSFNKAAMAGTDPVRLEGKDGVNREVPQPFAKLLAEHIQYHIDYEHDTLFRNMRKTLTDPALCKRMDQLSKVFGFDVKSLLVDLAGAVR